MYTDSWFHHGIASAVRRHDGPSYVYLFSYRGTLNVAKSFFGETKETQEDYGKMLAILENILHLGLKLFSYLKEPDCSLRTFLITK